MPGSLRPHSPSQHFLGSPWGGQVQPANLTRAWKPESLQSLPTLEGTALTGGSRKPFPVSPEM
jgi:hypothetical protein